MSQKLTTSSRGTTTSEPRQAANDLLARVEAATGPDRELDYRIWHALFPTQRMLLDPGGVNPPREAVWGTLADMPVDGWEDYRGAADHAHAHPITESLDAALALVELALPGEAWGLLQDALFSPRVKCSNVSAALPLALLAAMLRALGNTASPGSACSGDADTGEVRG